MAISTATINLFDYPKGIDNTQRNIVLRGTVSISVGDYPTVNNAAGVGGWALSWANITNKNGEMLEAIPLGSSTPSSTGGPAPFDVDVKSTSYNTTFAGSKGPSGYIYLWDSVQGNLHLFVTKDTAASTVSGPLVEYQGNVPGAVVNDTIEFTAYFARNN